MYKLIESEVMMQADQWIPDFPEPSRCGMRRWFRQLHAAGLLYHPDDRAETIVRIGTGELTFSTEESVQLNAAVNAMFAVHGDALYTVGLYLTRMSAGIRPPTRCDFIDRGHTSAPFDERMYSRSHFLRKPGQPFTCGSVSESAFPDHDDSPAQCSQ